MFDKIQVFQGENPDVWKYVFEKDDICVEAVLYRYESFEKRTVLCVSVQSGCPVGCTFCGTGKNFIRNLTAEEIQFQVDYVIGEVEKQYILPNGESGVTLNGVCEKLQIMFMSMGEPMLNWPNVKASLWKLSQGYPNADLLLSTVGIDEPKTFAEITLASQFIPKLGLQFSLHSAYDDERDKIIPFKSKMSVKKIRDAGIIWNRATGRPVYLNYCVTGENLNWFEKDTIASLFSPVVFNLTFSVVCKDVKDAVEAESQVLVDNEIAAAQRFFLREGYNVRKFDPAGKDDIGAGCGQLWYVQEWMKTKKEQ